MDSQQGDAFKPEQEKKLSLYIPQEVLNQLNHHLDSLPAQFRRMVVLLQECGIRLNELCSVSFNCLYLNAAGSWFLRYKRLKTKEECTIPVSSKAAAIIIEQQESLFTELRKVPHFLFSNQKDQAFSQKTFVDALNRMAYERDIRDATGEVWVFQARQFYFTAITQMMHHRSPTAILQLYNTNQPRVNVRSSIAHLFARHPSEEWMAYHLSQERRDEFEALLSRMWAINPLRFGYCTLPSMKKSPCLHTFWYTTPIYIHYFPIPDPNERN